MDDRIGSIDRLAQRCLVRKSTLDELHTRLLDQGPARVIANDERPYRTAIGQQPFGDVASDPTASARYENAHRSGRGSAWENQASG